MIETRSITLWRPVGTQELELIVATGMRAFPPRLPEQPIFYPVLTEAYATRIARDWNALRGGGYLAEGSGASLGADCGTRGIPFETIHTLGHATLLI
jgi:hypothetical protein